MTNLGEVFGMMHGSSTPGGLCAVDILLLQDCPVQMHFCVSSCTATGCLSTAPAYLLAHSAVDRPVRVGKGREEASSLLYSRLLAVAWWLLLAWLVTARITPVLRHLHLLPIWRRVDLLVYKSLHSLIPSYLTDDCILVSSDTFRCNLHPADMEICIVLRTANCLSGQSFQLLVHVFRTVYHLTYDSHIFNFMNYLQYNDNILFEPSEKLRTRFHECNHWEPFLCQLCFFVSLFP